MEEIYENDWENYEYCNQSYYEYDTGYSEYECDLVNRECVGGDIQSGCPLSFKYNIK